MIYDTVFDIFFPPSFDRVMMVIGNVTMYIALVLTVVSLVDYLIKNKDVLKDVD